MVALRTMKTHAERKRYHELRDDDDFTFMDLASMDFVKNTLGYF